MQILLLGATGRTGLQVLKEALDRNHTITALARNPESLTSNNPSIANHPNRPKNLTIVPGSPLKKADISTALSTFPQQHSVEVVITTLNPRRKSDSPFAAVLDPTDSPPRMMADAMTALLAALDDEYDNKNNTKKPPKIVALSALGAGSSAANTNCLLRLLFRRSNMAYTYEDHDAVEEVLVRQQGRGEERGPDNGGKAAAVPYVLVRPTRLVEEQEQEGGGGGGAAAAAKVFEGDGTVAMMATISRAAVARFLIDVGEKGHWDWKAPIIVG